MFNARIKVEISDLQEAQRNLSAKIKELELVIDNLSMNVKKLRGLVYKRVGYEDEEKREDTSIQDGLNPFRGL